MHPTRSVPPLACTQVRELEKRKAEDEQRRQQQAAIAAEKALIEQDKSARTQ